jgi:hypothetical protein
MDCYLELARFNEPVLEMKKVRDFLTRIEAPELSAVKQQVKATANLMMNFKEAVNFISLSVVPLKQAHCNVATIDTDNRQSNPGGQSGRGRGGHNPGGRGCGRG